MSETQRYYPCYEGLLCNTWQFFLCNVQHKCRKTKFTNIFTKKRLHVYHALLDHEMLELTSVAFPLQINHVTRQPRFHSAPPRAIRHQGKEESNVFITSYFWN